MQIIIKIPSVPRNAKIYRQHGTTEIYRYKLPKLQKLPSHGWRLVIGCAACPWLNGSRTLLFYHVLTLKGVKRVTFLY
jgi:hypothetical protein